MKPLKFKCRCGRGFASSICQRIGRVDVFLCETCRLAWRAEYEAETAQRAAFYERKAA